MLSKAITTLFTNDFRNFIIKYYILGKSKCSQHTLKGKHALRDKLIKFFFIICQYINMLEHHIESHTYIYILFVNSVLMKLRKIQFKYKEMAGVVSS